MYMYIFKLSIPKQIFVFISITIKGVGLRCNAPICRPQRFTNTLPRKNSKKISEYSKIKGEKSTAVGAILYYYY